MRALLRSAAAILERYAYDAFSNQFTSGSGLTSAANAATRLLYSGERTDRTGLHYLRARYYDPGTGRFNRLDPSAGKTADPISLHRYLYSTGDPILFGDPTGRFEGLVGLSVGSSIGAMLNNLTADIGAQILSELSDSFVAVDPTGLFLQAAIYLIPADVKAATLSLFAGIDWGYVGTQQATMVVCQETGWMPGSSGNWDQRLVHSHA